MLVHEFLERSAERLPQKTAIICGEKRLTYAEFESDANRLAHALLHAGFRRGDRAIIFLPNSIELAVSIFGVLKAGGVFVIANPTVKADKLAFMLGDCTATAFLSSQSMEATWRNPVMSASSLRTCILTGPIDEDALMPGQQSLERIRQECPATRPPNPNIDLDMACLIYTSGSTGEPKGVMSDHSNMVFAANSIIEYLENKDDDIVIDVLPLSFDYGLYQLIMVVAFGGTLVLERSFAYPAAVLQRIEKERVTGFPGVPTIFAVLLRMDLSQFDLSSLRYITNTAAALPPAHITELSKRFPSCRIYSMYGLTETKRTLYLPPDQIQHRPESVGIPIPGTEAWVEDEAGHRLGPDEVGELVVRGRHVMRGYWGDPVASAERFRPAPIPGERLCYTGDLFRMDAEGYFYFVGRKDDIIKSRGEKVAPKEVESVIYALEGIREAAVVGVPDPVLGEAVKAFVVADSAEMDERRVIAHCKAHLEDFMVPKYVEVRAHLPKTSSGKIAKRELVSREAP